MARMGIVLASLAVTSLLIGAAPLTDVGDVTISPVSREVDSGTVAYSGVRPRFTGIGDAAAQKRLNAQMAEWEKEALERTRAAAVTMLADDRSEQRKAEGVFSYEVKRNSGGLVSLLFSEYLYAGGANGLETKTGLTFFTDSGEALTLPGLFTNSEDGLQRVNALVAAELKKRKLESELLIANPHVEANQPFYLTDTDLVIVVPEVTWFPHSIGAVELSIPLTQFRNYLRPELQP